MVDPDYNEILDIIFDDEISEILAEMEDSPKTASELSEKFHITQEELDEKDFNKHYPFDIENVKEFAEFCIDSGGFEIC